jgi:hypothetical protein
MAYEAYKATVKHIAETAYKDWSRGLPVDQLMVKLAEESNVNIIDCRQALSRVILDAHHNRLLERSE